MNPLRSVRRGSSSLALLAGLMAATPWCAGASPPAAPAARAAATAASRDREQERAFWVRKHIDIVYLGSITHYSCYYLRDYVDHILLELGARKETLDVNPINCGLGRPPSVSGTFEVLEPVAKGRASRSAAPVAAHWASVNVSYNDLFNRVVDVTAKCQLVRTVFDKVLPLVSVRHARLMPGCVTYKLLTNTAVLRAQVLKPGAAPKPGTAADAATDR